MKNFYILSFLLFVIFTSCSKDDKGTIMSDKLEDQKWFKDAQVPCNEEDICKIIIQKGIYSNDTVYYSMITGELCDAIYEINLVNLNGELVKHYENSEMNLFWDEVTFLETVYQCDE